MFHHEFTEGTKHGLPIEPWVGERPVAYIPVASASNWRNKTYCRACLRPALTFPEPF